MEKLKIDMAICRGFRGENRTKNCKVPIAPDTILFLTQHDTFIFHVISYLQLQQQFSHKRAESFDFCKTAVTSTPKSQLIDPLRAKTAAASAATGIKSNCNVLPNPGMSPVLRKNIVMASQFRSKFNFLLLIFNFQFNLIPFSAQSEATLPHSD